MSEEKKGMEYPRHLREKMEMFLEKACTAESEAVTLYNLGMQDLADTKAQKARMYFRAALKQA